MFSPSRRRYAESAVSRPDRAPFFPAASLGDRQARRLIVADLWAAGPGGRPGLSLSRVITLLRVCLLAARAHSTDLRRQPRRRLRRIRRPERVLPRGPAVYPDWRGALASGDKGRRGDALARFASDAGVQAARSSRRPPGQAWSPGPRLDPK